MGSLDDPNDSPSSSPVTPLELRRYRAERLLRKDFAGLRAKVLTIVRSQLRGKGIALDPADLEACYAQAWHGLYATLLEGKPVESPSAWLVLVTFRRAIDEYRAKGRIGVVEGEGYGSYPRGSDALAQDLAAELHDRVRLRQVFEGMRATLSKRECEAASLCYLQGLSRAEAAIRMGISEARMRKLMEGAGAGHPGVAGKVGELLDTIKAGGWCEQQASLMRAYAFGILDPDGDRHALAVAHCRECSACRAHVASLRGLASVLPAPFLSRLALAGGGASVRARSAVGRQGSAIGGTSARRLVTNVPRLGSRFGVGGWSGLSGSLTAKLAVSATILLGAGYAGLGTRAHGSPTGPSPPAAVLPAPLSPSILPAPSPIHADVRSHSLFGPPRTRERAHASHPDRRYTTFHPHDRQATPAHRTGTPTAEAHEFGPERAGIAPTAPQVQSTPPVSSGQGSPTGEFGLE